MVVVVFVFVAVGSNYPKYLSLSPLPSAAVPVRKVQRRVAESDQVSYQELLVWLLMQRDW